MDVGTLDVRRKPVPEGQYKGTIMDTKWKDVVKDGTTTKRGRMRVKIDTDNPNVDESTIGKNVFDNLPWTENMKWKFGSIFAAANSVDEDDESLDEMTPERFEEGTNDKEVYFDIKHNIITGDDGKARTMVNMQNYKAVE